MEDVQDLREIEMPKDQEHNEEKGDEQGERQFFFLTVIHVKIQQLL